LRTVFLDAAKRMQAASFAGLRVFARVHLGSTSNKVSRKLFDAVAPVGKLLVSEWVLYK
jgi:hypothetical protein